MEAGRICPTSSLLCVIDMFPRGIGLAIMENEKTFCFDDQKVLSVFSFTTFAPLFAFSIWQRRLQFNLTENKVISFMHDPPALTKHEILLKSLKIALQLPMEF